MTHFQTFTKKLLSAMMAAALVVPAMATTSYAATTLPTEEGVYSVDATLSCPLVMGQMGSFEFGVDETTQKNIVTGAKVTVDENKDVTMTLSFGTVTGTIMGMSYTAYISSASIPGYYITTGSKKDAQFTMNSSGYVDTMTFPVTEASETYYLYVMLGNEKMPTQFGDTSEKYQAILSVDWSNPTKTATVDSTLTKSTTISYEYEASATEGEYVVSIPSKIQVLNQNDGVNTYSISLDENIVGGYVTVSTDGSGKLTSGSNSTTYTNVLTNTTLKNKGDKATGTITVATPPASGTYTGTVNFNFTYCSDVATTD